MEKLLEAIERLLSVRDKEREVINELLDEIERRLIQAQNEWDHKKYGRNL